uniref:EOG090X01XB n=1 Tax=Daphnia carinata TaxID=120202 RepID=A0A4Y7M3M9_9CRUS|nr:EOG090X01XB [Daphnia carinata]
MTMSIVSICRFVMLMKGEQYIKEAKESMSTPKVKHSLAAAVGNQPSPPREISEAELRILLGTPVVQTVLAMGVDLSRVKQALKYQIRNTGQPFGTVDSLLEAAIEFQHYNEHRQSLENGNGKEASTSNGPAGSLQVEEKRRRAWEQWSADDIAAFFEGLNEFGKDFDAIQNCLYTKNRKKSLVNSTNIKNKDQVRHFYYRTWHKISKYLLPTPDEGKRMHKELYGLINYGEMWKKLGGYFNDRCGEKLNELVQHGVTSVKIKGKSYRIKTPVCPALKRLQSTGTETQKLPPTPERIVIELTPCCNADFLRVQSVAHNPRIRISTDSSSPLSTIINFLTKKWKPRSILEAESVAEDELIMRITPEMKQIAPIGSTKKGRKRTFSGQEQMDETEVKLEVKSWILETSDQVTFSRMRQRLRRPLRYGTSLKRGSLAATLNKMPGPSSIQARPHPSSLMAQSTTVNITWPPEENGNGTGSFVLQVQLDGQQQQTSPQKDIPTASVTSPLYLPPKKGPDIQNGTAVSSSFTLTANELHKLFGKDNVMALLSDWVFLQPPTDFSPKPGLAPPGSAPTDGLNIPELDLVKTIPRGRLFSNFHPGHREAAYTLVKIFKVLHSIAMTTNRVVENKLSYFREDLGINSHHWHWHLIFPVEATGEIINPPDRRGELFYYMHQQILAR